MPPARWPAAALLVLLLGAAGCPRPERRTEGEGGVPGPASLPSPSQLPLELNPADDRLAELIVRSFEKSVAGRLESYQKIERVVREVAPLVERAAGQPEAREMFRAMVREGEAPTEEEARRRWIALQEADLLLESGGDPDALSRAGAAGVAQWMPSTGRANGLPVDEAASRRLTGRIDALGRDIAWREYLASPGAAPSLPGAPALSPEQAGAALPALRREREALRSERRRLDARYDPERAVRAQTRYLARLYRRFPGVDWLFQAYHGGEAGAARTLRRYVGEGRWPGSAAAAIRTCGPSGGRLTFERLYLATDPRTRPAAFAYLYGRADDHRYYWWKLRAAERAVAAYRRDPAALRRRWEAMLPGRSIEAMWYPDADAPHWSLTNGRLIPVAGLRGVTPAAPADGRSPSPPRLRPESAGLLALLTDTYRAAGARDGLTVGDVAASPEYLARRRVMESQAPPADDDAPRLPPHPLLATLPPAGPPEGFDFHQTGLAFDVLRPADAGRRKVLEYALGRLRDRHLLWWTEGERRGEEAYHVVPNPRYAAALAARAGGSGGVGR